jgi:V8-like Glu-specific endopeptidase
MRVAVALSALLIASSALAQSRTEELMSSRANPAGLDASSVGYLEVNTGERQNYGSASLIGPCHIKTAAHMFRTRVPGQLNPRAAARVSFGYERNGETVNFTSTHRVTQVAISPDFNPRLTEQPANDVATARIEPCLQGATIAVDKVSTISDIGQLSRRFAVVGFVPDAKLRPRLFAQRGCLWTGDGDALGILLNCRGRSGMSGGSVFMADGGGLVDVGVFTSSVSVRGKIYGAFSPLSANQAILP